MSKITHDGLTRLAQGALQLYPYGPVDVKGLKLASYHHHQWHSLILSIYHF